MENSEKIKVAVVAKTLKMANYIVDNFLDRQKKVKLGNKIITEDVIYYLISTENQLRGLRVNEVWIDEGIDDEFVTNMVYPLLYNGINKGQIKYIRSD